MEEKKYMFSILHNEIAKPIERMNVKIYIQMKKEQEKGTVEQLKTLKWSV